MSKICFNWLELHAKQIEIFNMNDSLHWESDNATLISSACRQKRSEFSLLLGEDLLQ